MISRENLGGTKQIDRQPRSGKNHPDDAPEAFTSKSDEEWKMNSDGEQKKDRLFNEGETSLLVINCIFCIVLRY